MTTFLVNVANDPGTAHNGTTGVTGTLSWAVAQVNANPSANASRKRTHQHQGIA